MSSDERKVRVVGASPLATVAVTAALVVLGSAGTALLVLSSTSDVTPADRPVISAPSATRPPSTPDVVVVPERPSGVRDARSRPSDGTGAPTSRLLAEPLLPGSAASPLIGLVDGVRPDDLLGRPVVDPVGPAPGPVLPLAPTAPLDPTSPLDPRSPVDPVALPVPVTAEPTGPGRGRPDRPRDGAEEPEEPTAPTGPVRAGLPATDDDAMRAGHGERGGEGQDESQDRAQDEGQDRGESADRDHGGRDDSDREPRARSAGGARAFLPVLVERPARPASGPLRGVVDGPVYGPFLPPSGWAFGADSPFLPPPAPAPGVRALAVPAPAQAAQPVPRPQRPRAQAPARPAAQRPAGPASRSGSNGGAHDRATEKPPGKHAERSGRGSDSARGKGSARTGSRASGTARGSAAPQHRSSSKGARGDR